MSGGRCDIQDIDTVDFIEGSEPDLDLSCFDPATALYPIRSTIESPEGIFHCLILSANKTFNSGWGFCRPDPSEDGETEDYYTIKIEEGRIASISRISPDTIDPASAEAPETEGFECGLQYVLGPAVDVDVDTGDDDWSGTPTSGPLPGGAKCQIGLYVDAGKLFNLQNCTTMELYVPACTSPSLNICTPLTQENCYKTSGCGWKGICAECSALSVSDCLNAGPGCKIDKNKCVPN